MIWASDLSAVSSPLRREARMRGAAIKVEASKRRTLRDLGRSNLPTITTCWMPRFSSDLKNEIERSK